MASEKMIFYAIGQIKSDFLNGTNVDISLIEDYTTQGTNPIAPNYILTSEQSTALSMSISDSGTSNQLFLWYKKENGMKYLQYSRSANGNAHTVKTALPKSPSVFGITLKRNNAGHIIVGTVDTLIDD